MLQPWLYFCYQIHASVVNSVTLSIAYINCHSVFIDDFKVYSDFVFAEDLGISHDISFFTIPCVSPNSIFALDFMRRSWIQWHCWFHTPAVAQYSLTISRSIVTLFSLTIYRSTVTLRFWQFHASAMILFLLWILCVGREFNDAVDSIRQLSFSIKWRYDCLERLSFH